MSDFDQKYDQIEFLIESNQPNSFLKAICTEPIKSQQRVAFNHLTKH